MYIHIFLNKGDIFAFILQISFCLLEKQHVFSKLLFLYFFEVI